MTKQTYRMGCVEIHADMGAASAILTKGLVLGFACAGVLAVGAWLLQWAIVAFAVALVGFSVIKGVFDMGFWAKFNMSVNGGSTKTAREVKRGFVPQPYEIPASIEAFLRDDLDQKRSAAIERCKLRWLQERDCAVKLNPCQDCGSVPYFEKYTRSVSCGCGRSATLLPDANESIVTKWNREHPVANGLKAE